MALWQLRALPEPVVRPRLREREKNGEAEMASEKSGNLRDDPTLLLFSVELALNGGNASGAARAVGWSASKGRRIVADNPELRRLVKRAVATAANDVLRDWNEMHAEARRRISELMDSDDDSVALRAAIYVIERVEGKVTQPVRDDTPKVSMNSVFWRFVASRRRGAGLRRAQPRGCGGVGTAENW